MQLVVVGAHQRTAPVAIRERLAFSPERLEPALRRLGELTAEAFIISTCNRVELYALVPSGDAGLLLRRFLATEQALPLEELSAYLYTFVNEDAVRHLFRVAAGLDSMALGEDQIMGQLKSSLQAADSAGTLGPFMNRLLRAALATGKLVRTDTQLGRAQLSVVSVALHLARQAFASLSGRRVLLIGAGRTGELALKHMRSEALGQLTVINRTFAAAEALAASYGGAALPLEALPQALATADLIISCTSAPDPLITVELAQQIWPAGREVLMLDLAVPRDIERRVGALPGITLYDVDDMQAVCDANRAARAAEVSSAEAIVGEQVEKFMHWWASQEALPTIRALRSHAEEIRSAELERALARLPGLSPAEQQAVAALTSAIVNKLLHHPITTLKQPHASEQLAQAAQQLFQLDQTARK